MKQLTQLILLISLVSCASALNPPPTDELLEKSHKEIEFETRYEIRPGEVTAIRFPYFYPNIRGELRCRDRKVVTKIHGDDLVAYVVESYFSELEAFQCTYFVGDYEILVADFEVKPKEFPSERLNVDMRHVRLSPEDQARVAREQKFLNKNYASSPPRPLFTTPFLVPLDSFITSIYGARRVFNNEKQTQHLGTDFRARPGVPIHASNAGRVVVARDLFYTGKTVTIDHGMNIFTIYGHFSEIKAVEGEFVPQGALIGLSGATGRVTAPHLHWGVRIDGEFIDGHTLVKATEEILD